jgi:ATP-binding cassette, subfamily A (ABC1), member 3
MLSGDTHPSSGSATICGFDVATQQPLLRRRIGYCPQFDALLELLCVREHIELYAR